MSDEWGRELNDLISQDAAKSEFSAVNKLEGMGELANMAQRLADIRQEIDDIEANLEEKKKLEQDISGRDIPNLMATLGLSKISLTNGAKVEVVKDIRASLPKEDRIKRHWALEYLKENGAEGIIKIKFDIKFDRGHTEDAQNLSQILENNKIPFKMDEDVHPQTYKGWLNEQRKEGKELPLDQLGAYEFSVTKIS